MATVADLIRRSLQTLGQLAAGETPTAAEEADAFLALNDMLDGWAAEGMDVSTFAAVGGEVDLPPGYARAIQYGLAVELAPSYGVAVPGEVGGVAAEAKFIVKRTEFVSSELISDAAVLSSSVTDITTLE